MSLHVVVVGAGIVGAASAVALQREGHRVTIVELGEVGGPQAASYGNGAWISPASVVPMSMPGLWRKVPGFLRDPNGPFTIRPEALLSLLPWLVRFAWSGATVARVEATAAKLRALLADAPAHHAALAAETGQGDLIRQTGLLYVYPDRAAFEAEALAWRLRRDNGVTWTELNGAELREREPDLAARYGVGVFVAAGAHCIDPGAYVAGLTRHAEAHGADFVRAVATGFTHKGGRLEAVLTDEGPIACDRAVIAAGIGSKALARQAGDRVSLVSERGYHVVVTDPEAGPRLPLMPSDGKMANTPTRGGLRASGQVELAGRDAAPNWERAAILLAHLKTAFPGLPLDLGIDEVETWMGHRPSTPDGVPVIGPSSATPEIIYAFGHGHVGLASGPITGQAVADLVAGRGSELPLAAYSARRFRFGF